MWRFAWVLLAAVPAHAGPVLVGEFVAIGVSDDGSLCLDDRSLCVLYDPPTDAPLGSDLLLPGSPFDVWAARWDEGSASYSHTAASPWQPLGVALTWSDVVEGADVVGVSGVASLSDGLDVRVDVDLPRAGQVIVFTTAFTARQPITGLRTMRATDNDPDIFIDGSYASINTTDGDAVVSGSRIEGGKALALALRGGNGAICTGWCATVEAVAEGRTGQLDGDRVIGVWTGPVDLQAGETVAYRVAYGLGTSASAAVDQARAAVERVDLDGDGVQPDEGDCDDRDAGTRPGAVERADGQDNDCDGQIDEGTPVFDDDGDGYSEVDGDCDDSDARVHPDAAPVQGVGDADCDGLADVEGFDDGSPPDGWGVPVEQVSACSALRAPPALAVMLLALIALARRRRS